MSPAQTWYDAFFMMLSGRSEEGMASFFLKLLMNFCFNFTVGMIGARPLHCVTGNSKSGYTSAHKTPGLVCRFGGAVVKPFHHHNSLKTRISGSVCERPVC